MNLAIVSDFNIAGELTSLWRAINKYTKHKARCIIAYDDSFQYDRDIILNNDQAKKEAAGWCNNADFFYFGRTIFNWPGIDFNKLLNKNNCCVKYYGSELRGGYEKIKKFHEITGLPAVTGTDWTITGRLTDSFYHLESYFTKFGDMVEADIPRAKPVEDGRLKIQAGSAGSPIKGYEFFNQAVQELKQEGVPIDLEFLMELSNKECLERKLNYNCTFTSVNGGWGLSGIEGFFLGHIVLSCLDPWVMGLYPSNPTVIIDKQKLKQVLKGLAENVDFLSGVYGDAGRKFAIENFSTKKMLKQHLYLFDLIMHREEYMAGGKSVEEIYQF